MVQFHLTSIKKFLVQVEKSWKRNPATELTLEYKRSANMSKLTQHKYISNKEQQLLYWARFTGSAILSEWMWVTGNLELTITKRRHRVWYVLKTRGVRKSESVIRIFRISHSCWPRLARGVSSAECMTNISAVWCHI